MPVSDSVFERLNTAQPYKSQDEIASDKVGAEKEAGLERSDEQTSFLTAMKEHFKAGVAGSAELANTGARLFMASVDPSLYMEMPATLSETLAGTKKTGYEKFPSFLQPGAARKALGVDDEAIKKEGPVARAFGGAAEGVGSVLSLPGVGPAKVAGETVVAGVKAAASAIGKNVTLGMGMGEVSEIGKYVFGGMGEWIDKHILGGEGTTGRAVGEEGGAIVGGGVGGYANNVRFNAMGAAASKGGKIVGKSVTSIGPAIADTIKAKRAGDERASFDIFMDHYSELKAQGLGYLQARTNEQIAAIIARDPQHQQELYDFHEATKQADVDANLFSTGQKAANPVLTQMESTQRRTKEEAATAAAGKSAQKGAIVTAYHKIVDKPLPTTVPAMKESLELFRTGTEAQAANMLLQKKELAQIIPNWSANEAAVSGKRFRDEWDIERAAAKAETKKSYDNVYAAADADGSRYDLAPVLKDTKEVLGPLLARVDTGTVPNSIRRLNSLIKGDERKAATVKAANENRPFYMKAVIAEQPKGYSFKELDDVVKELGKDANDAFRNNDSVTGQNLNKIAESIVGVLEKQSSKPTAEMYQKARNDYATKYVPRFREGWSNNMGREATAANRGRERIPNEGVWNQILRKGDMVDRMDQFDALAGGTHGSPVNRKMYAGLGEAIADKYSKEVLSDGFTREKHEKFIREYSPALDRVLPVRDRLENMAAKFDAINLRRDTILEHYQTVVVLPLTQAIGPVQAQKLLIQSLADPVKMEEVLKSPIANTPERAKSVLKEAMTFADPMKEGKYDPDKLVKLLTMGEKRPGETTSLQMLFDKALGPEEGKAHAVRLQAIAELMKREAMTNAQYIRFQNESSQGPVQQASGQTMASWVGQFYATKSGRIGGPYAMTVAGARFINNSMRRATTQAMEKALYDPAMSNHILELVQTPANQSVSRSTFDAVFGKAEGSRQFLKNLLDHGLIRIQISRGALYGATQNAQDPDRESDKPKRKLNMPQ